MSTRHKKMVHLIFGLACLIGLAGVLYLGYAFFSQRIKIFVIFSLYMTAVFGIAIVFGIKLINIILFEKEPPLDACSED